MFNDEEYPLTIVLAVFVFAFCLGVVSGSESSDYKSMCSKSFILATERSKINGE